MAWFLNMKTNNKLLIAFGLIISLLIITIIIAANNISAIRSSQDRIFTKDTALLMTLTQLNASLSQQRSDTLTMLISNDNNEKLKIKEIIQQRANTVDELFQKISALSEDNPSLLHKTQELHSLRNALKQTREAQFYPLVLSGKTDEALALILGIQDERITRIRMINEELINVATDEAKTAIAESNKSATQALNLFFTAGIISIILGVMMVIILNRLIANPLNGLTKAAEKIAQGDLLVNVDNTQRRDEIGQLTQAFIKMTQSLQAMAKAAELISVGDLSAKIQPLSNNDLLGNAFSRMITNLESLTRDIVETGNVLGSSTAQISSATSQLTSSSAETATAVSETTTTMEEVRQTTQLASQKAKAVADSAQEVAKISAKGKETTQETREGMMRIHEQMTSIAESMLRLSEQNQAIGEIITTVDDLAQQSNMLAVNASIEAAKAGDYGKGFGAVAQEIKNLADQSRQATLQVRTILSDVQKATSSAVMATEQGSKVVAAGVQKAEESRDSIIALATNVTEATQAATQIATSSHQQLVGVEQVVTAMENIKQASSQNVDSAKQLEIASQNLRSLGKKLQQLVQRYKLREVAK